MVKIKKAILSFIIIIEVMNSYPQAMLKNNYSHIVEKYNIVEKQIQKDYGYLKINIKIPQVQGSQFSNFNKEIEKSTDALVDEVEKVAKEYYGDINIKPTFPFELTGQYTITKNNGKIISMYIDNYQYSGGAHGLTTRKSYTLDTNTGNEVKIDDLFTKGYNYNVIICSEIKRQISEHPGDFFPQNTALDKEKCFNNFYIIDDSIVIYYQLYDIAPYAYGMPEFRVKLDLLDRKYLKYNLN